MYEIVSGYPLYVHYMGISSQFGLFPLLAIFGSVAMFNAYFLVYLAKDFAFETMWNDNAMIAHHIVSMAATACLSRSRSDVWLITVGEVGSGTYNLYCLAKTYDMHVSLIYWIYSFVMTCSNLYCVIGILRHKTIWYYKVPIMALILGRQAFVYL